MTTAPARDTPVVDGERTEIPARDPYGRPAQLTVTGGVARARASVVVTIVVSAVSTIALDHDAVDTLRAVLAHHGSTDTDPSRVLWSIADGHATIPCRDMAGRDSALLLIPDADTVLLAAPAGQSAALGRDSVGILLRALHEAHHHRTTGPADTTA
ncbi:hypothetical protein [Actinokineospora cianjurensis]|uniref:Uncharacterized protein n=1 Tax=Actinokineospora cianjurensis TaxID=585224 RepID=A0A421B201_9PSEU|nr:hypothetical protein [Actinokineospora cianjurensis]RLK58415.1 hypothetical protein CLV68_4516 [Actinokineospora cianjurensis]